MLLTYWRVYVAISYAETITEELTTSCRHLLFTLPPTLALFALTRPFLGRRDVGRILWHAGIATAYTFPWDSYIIHHKAWTYAPWAVSFTLSNVPVEEVAFFIIQSVMTSLFFILISLHQLPALYLDLEIQPWRSWLRRWLPVPILLVTSIAGWRVATPATHPFYLSCIAFWATPVLAFLWTLGGDHVLARWRVCLAAILIPTLYLCCVDVIALRRGTWHISEPTSTGLFVWPDLPVEEALFFFVTNSLVVCGMTAFDKAFAMLDLFPEAIDRRPPSQRILPGYSLSYIGLLVKALAIPLDRQKYLPVSTRTRIKSVRRLAGILEQHSRSFSTAALAFPASARTQLLILYGFCRVTDDLIDASASSEETQSRLQLIRDYLDVVYAQPDTRPSAFAYLSFLQRRTVPPTAYSAFTLLASLGGRYVPRKPFDDLCAGYTFDAASPFQPPRDTDELIHYARCVAGSVAEMCVYAVCDAEGSRASATEATLQAASDMGVALQLVNIARDLRDDAQIGRCYLPTDWGLGQPGETGFDYVVAVDRLLALAETFRAGSEGAIARLPAGCRAGVRAATAAYCAIGSTLRSEVRRKGYAGERVVTDKWTRAKVVLLEAYGLGWLRGRARKLA